MDFKLSEEQKMLKDLVDRFVSDHYSFEQRRSLADSELGYSNQHWQTLADTGLLALPFGEAYGGMGCSAVDTSVVMEAFGKGLVLEPYLSTVVMAGGLISALGTEAQKQQLLGAIGTGQLKMSLAYLEPQSRFNPRDLLTRASKAYGGYIIDGHKSVVNHGASADKIIVSARTGGAARDEAGISLFIVDTNSAGIRRQDTRTADGQRASEFFFDQLKVPTDCLLGGEGATFTALANTLNCAISAVSAEAVGAMEATNDITREYLKLRQQFGAALSSFQALQHRVAEMYLEVEMARSMSDALAMRLRDGDAQVPQLASATKVRIARAGDFVGENSVQLHGGIGMTDEYSIGHYFKRLMMINVLFGSQDYHYKAFEALSR